MRSLAISLFLVCLASISTGWAQDAPPAPSDVAAPPADAITTASGLASKVLARGTGSEHPTVTDLVTVQYTGWTTDGKMIDSTVTHGRPATFPIDSVMPGWVEGVEQMVVGEKRRLWIPESLVYKGQPGRARGTLVFDVELLSFTDSPTHPPQDVKAPPSDAIYTDSGLAYKVLKQGIGGRHPTALSEVTVNYSGWTSDGKLFDSSVVKGAPTIFTLDQVIPGWAEGLQLMVEGEKMRLWIPEKLAYKGQQPPFGMLVFDVELIEIH